MFQQVNDCTTKAVGFKKRARKLTMQTQVKLETSLDKIRGDSGDRSKSTAGGTAQDMRGASQAPLPSMSQPRRERIMKTSRNLRQGIRKSGPAQRKLGTIGRPIGSFKACDEAKLIHDIATGAPIEIACAAVGISHQTF